MVAESALDRDDPTGMDAAIAAYLAACDVEGKSPRTVQAYREAADAFSGPAALDIVDLNAPFAAPYLTTLRLGADRPA